MPELACPECGKRMFHENETTLKIEEAVHKKFCRKAPGQSHSYMHRDAAHPDIFDQERKSDVDGKPVLK